MKNAARYMAEIREKRLGAAFRKRAVIMLARALRKASKGPSKEESASQLSCSLLLETRRLFAAELPEDGEGERAKRGSAYSLRGRL